MESETSCQGDSQTQTWASKESESMLQVVIATGGGLSRWLAGLWNSFG